MMVGWVVINYSSLICINKEVHFSFESGVIGGAAAMTNDGMVSLTGSSAAGGTSGITRYGMISTVKLSTMDGGIAMTMADVLTEEGQQSIKG